MSRAAEMYPLRRYVELELEKIRKDPHNAEIIEKYYWARVADGISLARMYKCLWTVRRISKMLDKPFSEATKDDFVRVIAELEQSGFSDWTRMDFKVILKHFWRWFKNWEDGTPPEVRWIRRQKNPQSKRPILPKDLLTAEEKTRLLKATENPRDRALLEVLFESGRRLGEILTLRIRDIEFDEMGAKLFVHGKTGQDFVRIIASTPALSIWLDNHALSENPDSPVWIGLGWANRTKQLSYGAAWSLLKKIATRAGINKRTFFYLMRHTRVDETQGILTEPQQCMMFGWKFGSHMPAIYMKRYGKHIDNAQAIMNGRVPKAKPLDVAKPRVCIRCKFDNSPVSKFCNRCGALLDINMSTDLDQKKTMLDKMLYGIAAEPEKFEELREALVRICKNSKDMETNR
ncbi:MAG: site-specific integrase [Candidatus Nitrosotenuis sp.]